MNRIVRTLVPVLFALRLAAVAHPAAAQAPSPPTVVDVNSATLEELVRLPGIGETRARAILETRARRPFRRLQDLMRVPGIGRKTLERLAPHLTIGAPPPRTR
ncbi:MAG: helix-hairpin-helix domain-containing protein [Polyangiales bacterium]